MSILEKVGKLLKQAENASTEEEASAFMAKAQQIATVNAVDLAVARQAVAKREERAEPTQKIVSWKGMGSKNTKAHLVSLFTVIARVNDVKCNIYHDSSGVIAFGFPSDIEVVEALFGSLAVQMTEAADRYIRRGEHKGETVWRSKRVENPDYGNGYWYEPKYITTWGHFPVDGRTARASFFQGFSSRIGTRLLEARREAVESIPDFDIEETDEAGVEHTVESSAALVLANRGVEARDYYYATSKARGSWKGSSAQTSHSARSAGSTAGATARITSQRQISA